MIKMKELLFENVGGISPSDIFNFYYLERLLTSEPELFKTDYGSFISELYIKQWKEKYVSLFKQILAEQLQKYAVRKRVDPDFDASKISIHASARTLWELMQKTFRSDMKRRNDVWNFVGEQVTKLENAKKLNDIITSIDQLNTAVHNTGTLILGKFAGGRELERAYQTAMNTDPKYWTQHVDKDLRQIASSGAAGATFIEEADETFERRQGQKWGVKDKLKGIDRDISHYPPAFQKGYKETRSESWWQKFNAKMTDYLARMGSSRLR